MDDEVGEKGPASNGCDKQIYCGESWKSNGCGPSTNLACVKYLATQCSSLSKSNAVMYESLIDCLLNPVYVELNSEQTSTGTAGQMDLMPGKSNSVVAAGGASSLGNDSASPDADKHLVEGMSCNGDDCTQQCNLSPINNHGSLRAHLGCGEMDGLSLMQESDC